MIIPDIFKDKDLIYHYTTAEIAIQHILHKDELRLSPRIHSIDPFEKKLFSFSRMTRQLNDQKSEELIRRNNSYTIEIDQRIDEKMQNAKQLCFCQNSYSKNKFIRDHYGFLKPRMWDQYGGRYEGVCLAYSKAKLIEKKEIEYHGKVKYHDYSILDKNIDTIDLDSLDRIGLEKYYKTISKRVHTTFFQKHRDYRDENEYRFLSFSSNQYEYINTKGALMGIFFSPNLNRNDFVFSSLKNYASEKGSDLLYLDWNKSRVSVISENWLKKTSR